MTNSRQPQQGLQIERLLFVLSSLSPLFILWAIRGTTVISEILFISVCLAIPIVSSICLFDRYRIAKKNGDTENLLIESIEDRNMHTLTYLFSNLLPFYRQQLDNCRDIFAMLIALICIIFLFYRLNFYYMNILFLLIGYNSFMISSTSSNRNSHSWEEPFVLITFRRYLKTGKRLLAYRLSDTVYLEVRRP